MLIIIITKKPQFQRESSPYYKLIFYKCLKEIIKLSMPSVSETVNENLCKSRMWKKNRSFVVPFLFEMKTQDGKIFLTWKYSIFRNIIY